MNEVINAKDHIGEVHGIYTIVEQLSTRYTDGHLLYKCVCNVCGYVKYCTYSDVAAPSKKASICKHLRSDGSWIKHTQWNNKRIHRIFKDMMGRCYNVSDKDYKYYGGKGIKIFQAWLDNPQYFEEWALSNGYNDNLTIDRINADQDYCPTNCRWITLEENTRRAGKVNWVTIEDETLTGRQWAEKLGIGLLTIDKYIRKYGLDSTIQLIKAMLKEPPSTKHRKSHQTWFSVYGIQV